MKDINKIKNALRGLAVGDAIGYPLEFIEPTLEDFNHSINRDTIFITDDTQMTLFGFESVLSEVGKTIEECYLDWYRTQGGFYVEGDYEGLLKFPELWVRRAPGNTCLTSLFYLESGTPVKATASEGCGSVMRLLPFVLLLVKGCTLDEATEAAIYASDVTHPNEEIRKAVTKLMKSYYLVLNNTDIEDYPKVDSIDEIGEGWIASEAVDMALWAFMNATSFDHLLRLSTIHNGDSDSVGAIAGSLWGLSGREVLYYEKIFEKEPIEWVLR